MKELNHVETLGKHGFHQLNLRPPSEFKPELRPALDGIQRGDRDPFHPGFTAKVS